MRQGVSVDETGETRRGWISGGSVRIAAMGRDARATAVTDGVRVGVWQAGNGSDAGPGRYCPPRRAAH